MYIRSDVILYHTNVIALGMAWLSWSVWHMTCTTGLIHILLSTLEINVSSHLYSSWNDEAENGTQIVSVYIIMYLCINHNTNHDSCISPVCLLFVIAIQSSSENWHFFSTKYLSDLFSIELLPLFGMFCLFPQAFLMVLLSRVELHEPITADIFIALPWIGSLYVCPVTSDRIRIIKITPTTVSYV